MIKRILLILGCFLLTMTVYAQVGIGTSKPDSSSQLDITSINKGILLPRVELLEIGNSHPIVNPAKSLFVYNTATGIDVTPGFYYWDGIKWNRIIDYSELEDFLPPTTNILELKEKNLISTVNGVSDSLDLEKVLKQVTTNTLKLSGGELTSDVNGVSNMVDLSDLIKVLSVWELGGNTDTNPSTDYLGTKDAKSLVIKTNNEERIYIGSEGEVRINSFGVGDTKDEIITTDIAGNLRKLPFSDIPAGDKGDKGDTGDKGDQGDTGATGPQGPSGADGAKGEKGDTGDQGLPGDKGDQGDTGAMGPQGPSGTDGAKGEKGDTGDQGLPGDKGDTGAMGPQGPSGTDGAKGEKGDTGDQGDTGAVGPQGPSGADGVKGEKGDTGDQGLPGDKGDQGDTGAVGPQGPSGADGAKGEKGDTGDQGLPGDKGDQGDTGAVGPQGPSGADGAKGEKGDTGDQGLPGDKGDQGDTGAVGPQGPSGADGSKGEKGDTGDQGLPGDKGDQGDTGAMGPQGPSGADGAKGEKGDTGDQGLPGDKGDQGDTGAVGPQGPSGADGSKGEKGDTGDQGLPGDKGDQGDTGAMGPQGPSGADGSKGEKGDTGDQGLPGDKGDQGDTGAMGPQGPSGTPGVDAPLYTADTGLALTGTTFSAKTTEALWHANQILEKPISGIPATDNILKYNGTSWVPAAETLTPAGWGLKGNVIKDGDFIGGTNNTHDLIFMTSNVERMRIKLGVSGGATNGFIGIGEPDPKQKLHVNGKALITGITSATDTDVVTVNADGVLNKRTVASLYTASTGLSLSGTTFSARTTEALWNANKLQGKDIADNITPSAGMILKFDGDRWIPFQESTSYYNALKSNSGTELVKDTEAFTAIEMSSKIYDPYLSLGADNKTVMIKEGHNGLYVIKYSVYVKSISAQTIPQVRFRSAVRKTNIGGGTTEVGFVNLTTSGNKSVHETIIGTFVVPLVPNETVQLLLNLSNGWSFFGNGTITSFIMEKIQ